VVPLKLIWRNLLRHKLRVLLTAGSLTVAFFLLCVLRALVVSLDSGVKEASSDRLVVQSAVSLFVNLPASYQGKIEAIDGVEETMKMTWFGGYYKETSNMFAQFAVDSDRIETVYPEIKIVSGSWDDFRISRTACLIGKDTAAKYGWSVGQRIPLMGAIYPRSDGSAWEFDVAAIYDSVGASIDDMTMFFHWEYLDEAMKADAAGGPAGIGVFTVLISEDADQLRVGADIDALFEHGPQRVQSTREAEFNAQFVSMVGNVPFFVGAIGTGVLIAILLATLNTMLMAGREQTRDVGVLKALGFGSGAAFWLMLSQSILLCGVGAGAGILLAISASGPLRSSPLGTMFPGLAIGGEIIQTAVTVALAVSLFAGLVPAVRARRLTVVEALREEI